MRTTLALRNRTTAGDEGGGHQVSDSGGRVPTSFTPLALRTKGPNQTSRSQATKPSKESRRQLTDHT